MRTVLALPEQCPGSITVQIMLLFVVVRLVHPTPTATQTPGVSFNFVAAPAAGVLIQGYVQQTNEVSHYDCLHRARGLWSSTHSPSVR